MKTQNTANNGRKQATQAAIGSIRCEGLHPSEGTKKHLQNYSDGRITADQLHENVMNEVESILVHSSN